MRSTRIVFFILTLLWAVSPMTITTGQEKEKQQSGSTVDAWRQALPPEAESQKTVDEIPGVAASQQSNSETRKTLLSLERRWMDSLRVGDADSLSQIISGDFTFASPRLIGIKDRIKYLEYALRDLKLTSYELEKTTVRIFGRTAIVSGLLRQKATVGGQDWGGTYLVTDVWISRDGIWRVVSRHESPLSEQK